MYSISDHPQGKLFDLDQQIGFAPAVQKILVECGATYLRNRQWTISPKRADDLAATIDAWLADGRPENGLPKGGDYGVTHLANGYYISRPPKSMVPAIKRLGAYWNPANSSWAVPAAMTEKFEKLVAKSQADARAASEENWPVIPGVTVTVRPDGSIAVVSPFDPAIKDAIKSVPTSRWDRDRRVWVVMAKYRAALRKALARIAGEAEAANDANETRLTRASSMRKIRWSESGTEITVTSEYDEDVIHACRARRMKWDSLMKVWRGKMRHDERDALLDRLIEIDENLRNPAQKSAPATTQKTPAQTDTQTATPRRPQIIALDGKHNVGDIMRIAGRAMVVEELGNAFEADADIGSIDGKPGWEGEYVQQVYLRPADDGEEMELEAREGERRKTAEASRRCAAAKHTVFSGEPGPEIGHAPKGEIIWDNGGSGYREYVISDGEWLYGVIYDGLDGSTWGNYCYGYNCRGTRVPHDADLVTALRGVNER
ncbi:hypothetical protein [Pelagibacterium sp.]|uniref:hypothetical protein n=1 Tax=Pelagibacterium sp. TaxID=1967288 RepID=UPI003A926745